MKDIRWIITLSNGLYPSVGHYGGHYQTDNLWVAFHFLTQKDGKSWMKNYYPNEKYTIESVFIARTK